MSSAASRRVALLVQAFCAATLLGCAHGGIRLARGEAGEVVEAEGWAPVQPQDPIGTRQRAMADAQKKAVEKVVGVYISAKTRVEAAVTVEQKILANVEGYLRRYEVVGEREEQGIHKTRIRAFVLYAKLGEDLRGMGLVRPAPPPGNPKVAVFVRMEEPQPAGSGDDAAAAIRRALLERGFSVMNLNDAFAGSGVARSTGAAAALGLKLQADLAVLGEGRTHPIEDARLGDFHSSRARLRVHVTKPGTGETVIEKTQEASAIDPVADVAAAKSLETAGQMIGSALATELASIVNTRIGVLVRLEKIGGLEPIERFSEDLRGTPGIAEVTLSGYRDGVAELMVTTEKMSGEDLAAEILRMKQYRFLLRGATPYEVELEGS